MYKLINDDDNKNIKNTKFIYSIENLEIQDTLNDGTMRYHIFDYHVLSQLSFLTDNINNFESITFESKTIGIKTTITLEEILIRNIFYEKIIFEKNNKYFVKLPFWFSQNEDNYFVLYLAHHEITAKMKEKCDFELYANVIHLDSKSLKQIEESYERNGNLIVPNIKTLETSQSFYFNLDDCDMYTTELDLKIATKELIWFYVVDKKISQICNSVSFEYESKNIKNNEHNYYKNGWYTSSMIVEKNINVQKNYNKNQLCYANQFLRDKNNSCVNEKYYVLQFCMYPKKLISSGEFINYGSLKIVHNIDQNYCDKNITVHIVAFGYNI
jgi:hypothetical protein